LGITIRIVQEHQSCYVRIKTQDAKMLLTPKKVRRQRFGNRDFHTDLYKTTPSPSTEKHDVGDITLDGGQFYLKAGCSTLASS